jgi:hypothetical protein
MEQVALVATYIHDGFLLGLFFDTGDGTTYLFQTVVDFQHTTQHYIPECRTHLSLFQLVRLTSSYVTGHILILKSMVR